MDRAHSRGGCMTTLDILLHRYNGKITLNVSDIAQILGYCENHCRNLISQDKFPIQTFLMGSRRVARVDAVAAYIDNVSASPKRRGPKTKAQKIAEAKAEVRHA